MAVFDYLKKGLCRFLIHRYMGDYLKTTIKSDNLEIQLLDGTVSVKNVNLNVQHINSLLDPIGLVNVVEGLIGEVSINVPFQKLMDESVVIMIKDLFVTLTPIKNLNVTQDLMSSVIGTLVSTMETSVTSDDLLEDAGSDVIEQFANVIDQVVTRVKIVFENITIRLENEGELSTAVEVTIKEMEFIDEQLETCRQEGLKDNVVTSQPLLTNSVDLNKLIHIKDVRVFTDVWTPSNSISSVSTNSDGGDMMTSMGNSAFQSCYSHFSSSGRDNQREARHELRSKPIQIAHFCGEKHTIKIQIHNAGLTKNDDAYGKKIEIDMQMSGSLFFCLTPSQIVLLHDIMSRLVPHDTSSNDLKQMAQGGKPMQKEHFEQITAQLQNEGPWMRQVSANTWSAGANDHYFHELTKRSSGSNLVPVSLDGGYDDYTSYSSTGSNFRYDPNLDSDSMTDIGTQRGSNSTLIERTNTKPPDVFILAVRVPNVFGIVTHEDPLSKENTEKALAEDGLDGISKIMDNFYQTSTQFFQSVVNLKLTSNPLYLQRKNFSKAYSGDHIRLLAQTVSFRLNSETNGSHDNLTINAAFSKFDLIESLTKETNHDYGKSVIIDLLKFGDNTDVALHLTAMMNQDHEIDYSIEINCQACQSEIDPSIIDRLHNLIVPRPFFLSSAKSTHFEKNTLESSESLPRCRVRFYCPKWEVDLRIPVADVENHVPFWHRNVYDEFTRIEFNELRLDMPKFKFADISNFGTIHINSHSMTATMMGDSKLFECLDDERRFLHTTNLTGIGDTHVCLSISYDFRNKSINANTNRLLDPLTKSMTQSIHGSFFKFNDEKEEGPFAHGNEFIEDTKLLLAGNRDELADFSDNCRKMSDINIELSLPRLHLYFPSKKFFEVLYNRFANDFALFAPRAPIFKAVNNELGSQNLSGPVFRPFTNDEDDEFGASEYDTREALDKSSLAHKMALTVKVNKGNILIGAVGGENENEFSSQIGSELDKTDFFLVFGYHGDLNLMYMYIAADKFSVLHRNLFDNSCRPFDTNVCDLKTFMRRNVNDVFAEPLTTNEFCPLHDDNNVVVAMKIFTHYDHQAERDFKDIVLAVALRNTLTHFRPFTDPEHFWVTQLTKFFAVEDYGVPGYEWPQVIINLNVHFTNLVVAYDHCNVVPDSPLKLRIAIGSCDLASNIVQSMERFKFHCFLEETKMFIATKKKDTVRFQGYSDSGETRQRFIKFLGFGMLKLELNYSLGNPKSEDLNERCPNIEIICSNDVLKAWLCADTVIESFNMLLDFLQSDYASALNNKKEVKIEPVAEFVKAATNIDHRQLNFEETTASALLGLGDERNRVLKLMSSAMEDQPQSSKLSKTNQQLKDGFSSDDEAITANLMKEAATNNYNKSSSSTDDEFIVVDEIPGSGITQPSGAPRIRILDNSFEMVSEFMCTPDNESEIMKLPKGHPLPILKYSIRDFSLQLYLYGGNDLGNCPSEVKPYSQWEQKRESSQCMRDESVGGPYRDHTVCIQAQISRVSFISEVFGPNAPILSRNMLTIYDIELKDHLLVSQINKLFYQFTSEMLPRRSFAPMVSIRVVEDQNREGKIKVNLLPMRLNVDQDTLEFLQDFFTVVGSGLKLPTETITDPAYETPIFEIPVEDLSTSENVLDSIANQQMNVNNVNTFMNSNSTIDQEDGLCSDLTLNDVNKPVEISVNSNDVVDQKCASEQMKETFFKSFVFSPGCKIRLDYVGKRVKMDHEQGTVAGLLLGLSKLHCTELVLKDLHNEKGLLGYGKCVQFVVEEWVNDIKKSQIPNVIGSFGPITSLVEIARGITDLFYIPLTEFRKEDGRVVKGIQRGASSFGVSAASAAIDTTQWFASVVHSIAEIAFDIVTPDYQAAQRARREQENQQRVPNDIREGLHMAMGTVYEGVLNSAQTLQMATQEDRAHGQWPIRGILRNATPMAVKPIVIATQATMHVLGGIKSQLRPDIHREEIDKWKHLNRT